MKIKIRNLVKKHLAKFKKNLEAELPIEPGNRFRIQIGLKLEIFREATTLEIKTDLLEPLPLRMNFYSWGKRMTLPERTVSKEAIAEILKMENLLSREVAVTQLLLINENNPVSSEQLKQLGMDTPSKVLTFDQKLSHGFGYGEDARGRHYSIGVPLRFKPVGDSNWEEETFHFFYAIPRWSN